MISCVHEYIDSGGAYQTIHNHPSSFKGLWQPMIICVHECINLHVGLIGHLF